ncbi:AP2 domain transcription factor AP2VIIb-2 [Besnoitia besnoiti]|uniref:AP2 domain transcription factor AP2VIIb-2 n=1 Tax=Besnoitia besnoiti TaxID=94643 RepID=A0A2A9MPA2_BESBE|nr:AP2 domain transcription factor AP2VIIb-2 [Besnoitia besnoiti]PFH37863.1 AP2 domain transcription factor AP2VIIb-2 [Besnoitia besnoiti]
MRGVNVIEEPNEGRPAPLGEKHTEEKSEARGFGAGTASASVLSQQATPPGGNFWQTHEQTEKTETEEGGESTVYRQPEGMVQHVFQWGIGNAFRAISVNRYRPVHAARPKEVSIHPSYFVSPHPCVIWEPLNEAWEVYFYENRKKSAKPFPVKKFGIARAKREALDFLKQMEEEGRLEKPTFASGVEGVTFDQVTGSWICRYIDADGRSMSRGFSADFHGFEEAKNLAEERKAATMENLRNDFLGANMRLVKDKQTS